MMIISNSILIISIHYRRIIVKYQEVNNRTLSCDFRHKTIQDFSVEQFNELEGNSYDFIMSSKMVCEVIAAGNGTTDNSYYDFVKTFFPFLKFEGVCLLLDVTTRCPHLDSYYPMMLGRQINRAIQENDRMALVVPRSCAIYGKECSIETCFHQKEFTISHSGVRSDKCRVAYRILGHRPFVQNIIKFDNSSKLSVSCDRFCKFTELRSEFYSPSVNIVAGRIRSNIVKIILITWNIHRL